MTEKIFAFMALVLAAAADWSKTASPSSAGSCGLQCSSDADCQLCGSTGRCLGSDSITRICVDAPAQTPASPKASPVGLDWPDLWAADMVSVTYNDFRDKMSTKQGRFYYDFKHLRQKQDFGRTSLIYVGSKFYFVAFGFTCFYVDAKDPLSKEEVAIPRPNFMRACAEVEAAKYVGRELVHGEWADHYSCAIDYANQTIAFQSWHSLGLDRTKAGLPLALSAGDSKPTWQAPRLTTTYYSNVTTEAAAVPDSLFKVPKVCIPLPSALALREFPDLPQDFQAFLASMRGPSQILPVIV